MTKNKTLRNALLVSTSFISISSQVAALSLDGEGHYSLRGETRTAPGFSKETGMHEAIDQFFRLETEARFNDRSSFFMEFRLFDHAQDNYLGDSAAPKEECPAFGTSNDDCSAGPQFTAEPRYKPYTPMVTKAYARYAFDFCLLEAGRRGRDWGMGIFLDAGESPFDTDATVFDGVTCDIPIEKDRSLGFSFGYDKIAETGAPTRDLDPVGYGSTAGSDDIDQYFFTIRYDDRKANAGSTFTKDIGLYFANVLSDSAEDNGKTDIKFLDLYTAFFMGNLTFRNEILIRLGKSEDPYWYNYGGSKDGRNSVEALGLAGSLEWTLSRSGSYIGPKYLGEGDAQRQVLFVEYARAPGDESSYYARSKNSKIDTKKLKDINELNRDTSAKAMGFHRNYNPALILFNGRSNSSDYNIPGAFSAERMINASMFSLGYRYESLEYGNFEAKVITAQMVATPPSEVKDYWLKLDEQGGEEAAKSARDDAGVASYGNNGLSRPAGTYGSDLGSEIDLKFWVNFNREVDLGIAAAYAVAGDAWKVQKDQSLQNAFLIQSFASFKF